MNEEISKLVAERDKRLATPLGIEVATLQDILAWWSVGCYTDKELAAEVARIGTTIHYLTKT